MKTLIKHATVVLPHETAPTSVSIDGDRIADIDAAIQTKADEVVDAAGLYLLADRRFDFPEPNRETH